MAVKRIIKNANTASLKKCPPCRILPREARLPQVIAKAKTIFLFSPVNNKAKAINIKAAPQCPQAKEQFEEQKSAVKSKGLKNSASPPKLSISLGLDRPTSFFSIRLIIIIGPTKIVVPM